MIRKILFLILALVCMNSTSIKAEVRNVELFDIQREEVTQILPVSPLFQKTAEDFLKNINSVYVKVSPVPKEGYMIKIPLEPSVQVNNQWMNSLVDEIIIVLPKGEEPFLITFDEKNNIYVFNFIGNTNILKKTFQLNL